MDRLTIAEYEILMQAVELKQFDITYRNHIQAYLNFAVKAEKKTGKNKTKPVFSTFDKFFNYKKELNKVLNRHKKKDENEINKIAEVGKLLSRKGG